MGIIARTHSRVLGIHCLGFRVGGFFYKNSRFGSSGSRVWDVGVAIQGSGVRVLPKP